MEGFRVRVSKGNQGLLAATSRRSRMCRVICPIAITLVIASTTVACSGTASDGPAEQTAVATVGSENASLTGVYPSSGTRTIFLIDGSLRTRISLDPSRNPLDSRRVAGSAYARQIWNGS